MKLDSKIPAGPLADKWNNHKAKLRLVNPANRRKYHVIVVGSGLAGSAAAASFAGSRYWPSSGWKPAKRPTPSRIGCGRCLS